MRTATPKGGRNANARRATATALMEFFFPVHYEIGTALEDVVRSEMLSRQQAASLWLIRSQGEDGCRMRRKDVEANMRRWFEVTSAAVSKALRAMMRPPLGLIDIIEDPRSGREKLVTLTPKGKAFLDSAAERATTVLVELIEDVSPELAASAIEYFGLLTRGFQRARTRVKSDRHLIRPEGMGKQPAAAQTRRRMNQARLARFNEMTPIGK
jgi:DNA-binding MarR family transcriptional regulator